MTPEKRAVDASIRALLKLSVALAGAHVDGVECCGTGGPNETNWLVGGTSVQIDCLTDSPYYVTVVPGS